MDHSSSPELSSTAAVLRHAYNLLLTMKDNRLAQDATESLAQVILDLDSSPPRQPIRTIVDNTAAGSAGLNHSIADVIGDAKINGNGCSAGTGVVTPLQALPSTPRVLPQMPSPTSINTLSKSALVIEHNEPLSKMLTAHLKHWGYVVRTAFDADDGLRLYRDCAPFDVVLIDYGMPEKEAIDVAIAILGKDPSQQMIITAFEYRFEDEVTRPKELMHIPLLFDVSNSRLRKLLEKLQFWATKEEVHRAVAELTRSKLLKLRKFADYRVRILGRAARGWAGEDLLGEALLSTLIGAEHSGNGRRWNKRVDLGTYLVGAMRSISDHWKDKFDECDLLECETVVSNVEGQELSPLDNVASGHTAADQRLITQEEVGRILGMFKGDKEATLVLEGWSKDMKKNEIMQEHGLTEKQYQAAVKRIRMKPLIRRNRRGRGEEHGR